MNISTNSYEVYFEWFFMVHFCLFVEFDRHGHYELWYTLTKIINATLLFLPQFFLSLTQRSKTFYMYTKGLFLSNIVHKSV